MYCKVIVPVPFNKEFVYKYSQKVPLKIGHIVQVPFGNRKQQIGIVSNINPNQESIQKNIKLKEIHEIVNQIKLKSSILDFINWVSNYTLNSKGLVANMILPNYKIISYKLKEKDRSLNNTQSSKIKLNKEQKKAFNYIRKNFGSHNKVFLLEGVTGSGKTEVYFELIDQIIKSKLQILILLPEISLTPQVEYRFYKRFGFKPDLWHSKINESVKKRVWHKCHNGESKIVIGARSSLFLPFKNLGLIIVDEEHDSSYKQEDGVRYNARDMAIVRSSFEKIPIILSTATPSIETYYNIKRKKYKHVFLSKQYSGFDLPKINLIDLKNNNIKKNQWISDKILNAIERCLKEKKQSLLFLNRRGYAPLTICGSCGDRLRCNNCSSWLVFHNKNKNLICHHCGYTESFDNNCKNCNEKGKIKFIGPGIERISEELKKYFPEAIIENLSSDTMNTQNKIKKIIERIENKEVDILVGTQILAKGYHFPNLSIVGILDADAGLMGGDLRASENNYNLLQQVSGRAGRTKSVGEVYIQTYFTKSPLITSLKNYNRINFLEETLSERKKFNLPPYSYLIAIVLSGSTKSKILNFAKLMVTKASQNNKISIYGPVEAPMFLLRGKFRYRLLIKGQNRKELNIFAKKWLKNLNIPSNIRLSIDVDPYSFI